MKGTAHLRLRARLRDDLVLFGRDAFKVFEHLRALRFALREEHPHALRSNDAVAEPAH